MAWLWLWHSEHTQNFTFNSKAEIDAQLNAECPHVQIKLNNNDEEREEEMGERINLVTEWNDISLIHKIWYRHNYELSFLHNGTIGRFSTSRELTRTCATCIYDMFYLRYCEFESNEAFCVFVVKFSLDFVRCFVYDSRINGNLLLKIFLISESHGRRRREKVNSNLRRNKIKIGFTEFQRFFVPFTPLL